MTPEEQKTLDEKQLADKKEADEKLAQAKAEAEKAEAAVKEAAKNKSPEPMKAKDLLAKFGIADPEELDLILLEHKTLKQKNMTEQEKINSENAELKKQIAMKDEKINAIESEKVIFDAAISAGVSPVRVKKMEAIILSEIAESGMTSEEIAALDMKEYIAKHKTDLPEFFGTVPSQQTPAAPSISNEVRQQKTIDAMNMTDVEWKIYKEKLRNQGINVN
jgi:hypothetical protein